jgi:hypothetical protein
VIEQIQIIRVFEVSTVVDKKREGRLRTDLLITLENVKPPPDKRLASLRRLIVFEQGARSVRVLDRVRRGREQARRREIGLGLVFGGWRCGW